MFDILAAAIITMSAPQSPIVIDAVTCVQEDGNTDGMPCVWTDPDTGTQYWVTSENYR